MPKRVDNSAALCPGRLPFPSTQWSLVRRAGGEQAEAERTRALQQLAQSYWYPLYAYLRRRGCACDDAQDAVQGFFVRLLEQDVLAYADPARGRFRAFLIAAMQQFLAREHQQAQAQKRQPTGAMLSLDTASGEERYRLEPVDQVTPEKLLDYTWAVTMLERAFQRLQQEQDERGKGRSFACLRGCLTGQAPLSGRQVARELGMSEGAVRVLLHRLRQRYGELLREEVAQTLTNPEDVDDELRHLQQALRME